MRVVILGSGGGSNAKAILQAQRDGGGSADSGCAPFANRYTLT
jgi:folate-dependent phosphoribosylglycinamide formyltransferase PurN